MTGNILISSNKYGPAENRGLYMPMCCCCWNSLQYKISCYAPLNLLASI